MTNEQERAEFEAWALTKWPGATLSPYQNNCGITIPERYKHPKLQAAWEAWQAGRAALQSPEIQELRKDVERMCEALKEAAAELNCLGSELEDIYSENPTMVTTLPDPNVLSMIRSVIKNKQVNR